MMPHDPFDPDPEDSEDNLDETVNTKKQPAANDVSEELSPPLSHEELMQKLNDAEQKANQSWDRLLRMQADNDNLMRRVERDVANAHKFALEKFATELLPIVDSLELCVNNVSPDAQKNIRSVLEGVQLTLKMFYSAMEKFGITVINPLSEPFNPEYHQAISMKVDTKVVPGTVISVLQKGYRLNQRLLRPALVVVAKADE